MTNGSQIPPGQWEVLADNSQLHVKTSRLGLISVQATAPVGGGRLSDADPSSGRRSLRIEVLISRVRTDEHFIDPELHELIMKTSDGVLVFEGDGIGSEFQGNSSAGTIVLPMSLSLALGSGNAAGVLPTSVDGRVDISDMHVPLPGFSRFRSASVTITGQVSFTKAD